MSLDYVYVQHIWDGFPLGLGVVIEDRPTELSCGNIM